MKRAERKQRGIVLLALLLVVVISSSTFVVTALNSRQDSAIEDQQEVGRQLSIAKANLLAYVAYNFSNSVGPGFLPCPDMDNDGEAETYCDSNQPILGRLPEYVNLPTGKLPLNNYYAGIDEQFWYVAAPRYVFYSTVVNNYRQLQRRTSKTLAAALNFRLKLDGGEAKYVAFIIAPGEALDGQDRGSKLSFQDYLDGGNGSNNFNYYTRDDTSPAEFNDRVIGITLDEFMEYATLIAAQQIKMVLDDYRTSHSDNYPSSTSQGTFRGLFDSHANWWLRRTSTTSDSLVGTGNYGNGERWSSYTTYTLVPNTDSDVATLTFAGCTGISITITPSAPGIERTGEGC